MVLSIFMPGGTRRPAPIMRVYHLELQDSTAFPDRKHLIRFRGISEALIVRKGSGKMPVNLSCVHGESWYKAEL